MQVSMGNTQNDNIKSSECTNPNIEIWINDNE